MKVEYAMPPQHGPAGIVVEVVVPPMTVVLVVVAATTGLGHATGAGASFALKVLASFWLITPPKRAQ
jgi:hypothetical protein